MYAVAGKSSAGHSIKPLAHTATRRPLIVWLYYNTIDQFETSALKHIRFYSWL
jgi:hypothetical protein